MGREPQPILGKIREFAEQKVLENQRFERGSKATLDDPSFSDDAGQQGRGKAEQKRPIDR